MFYMNFVSGTGHDADQVRDKVVKHGAKFENWSSPMKTRTWYVESEDRRILETIQVELGMEIPIKDDVLFG